jgi:hypothetical protein
MNKKFDILVHQYELFKMLPNKFITSMFTRMTIITNNLDALGGLILILVS